ncbi:MAG TPA: hypothetical protein VM754_11940 [Actinomycetota bacterium]|nr:hypothetical protein [Actinomycetota bacterium]
MAHALAIRSGVFIFLGAVQISAIGVILFYSTVYAGSSCASDRQAAHGISGLVR